MIDWLILSSKEIDKASKTKTKPRVKEEVVKQRNFLRISSVFFKSLTIKRDAVSNTSEV